MNQDDLLIHIDPGSMSVFAAQILEAVRDARSVIVHDTAGRVVWASPGIAEEDLARRDEIRRQDKSQPGTVLPQDNGNNAYVFDLNHASSSRRIASSRRTRPSLRVRRAFMPCRIHCSSAPSI